MEAILHTQKQNIARAIVPKSLLLLVLCALFYILTVVNLNFLFKDLEIFYYYIILIFIVILYAIEVIKYYIEEHNVRYIFYEDRVEKEDNPSKSLLYNEATRIEFEENFIDKLFHTGTISIYPGFKIRHIHNSNNTYFYIQKLIQRSRKLERVA